MTDARTIALLARAPTTTLDDAAVLIQKFADATAAERVTKAVSEAYDRALAIVSGIEAQRAHLHDAERIPDVGASA